MTGRKLSKQEVDRLLRATLTDDLPPPEELRLRETTRRDWARMVDNAPRADREWVRQAPLLVGASGAARAALGAAAGLLVALGLAMHLAIPPRLVAASLSVQNAALRVASELRRATAMTCLLETADDEGRPRRTRIDWRAPDDARVTVEDARGGASWSLRVPRSAGAFGEGAPPPGPAELGDPRLSSVHEFLSPEGIEGLLAGRWEVAKEQAAGPSRAVFDVAGRHVRVTIDRASDLPVRVEGGFVAILEFTPGEEARLSLAATATGSRHGGS